LKKKEEEHFENKDFSKEDDRNLTLRKHKLEP